MHRSGTSACTRVLNLLGCALPDDLIGAGDGNELGHWESVEAVNLNDEMLASAGSAWADWGPINEDWQHSAVREDMIARASLLIAEHAKLGPLFALKDPRMCRLADVWLAAMADAKVQPLVIMMLRNPAEVIASLEERDLMAPGYGQLLWLRHVLDAEHLSRGQRRVTCHYDQLMSNWHGMVARIRAELQVALPRNAPAVHAQIDQFLTDNQRHHQLTVDAVANNPALSDWLRRTYAILLAWSETGEEDADHAELDAIRTEFDRAYSAFARLLLHRDIAGAVFAGSQLKRQLSTQLADVQRAAAATQAAAQDAEARISAHQAREAELTADLARQQVSLKGANDTAQLLKEELVALQAELHRLGDVERQAEALRVRQSELAAEVIGLQTSLRDVQTEAAREQERRQAAETQLADQTAELRQQTLHIAELTGRTTATESALLQRQEELAQLWNQLVAAEKSAVLAEAGAVQERDRRAAAEHDVAAIKTDLATLQRRLDEALSMPAPSNNHLFDEIAHLTSLLLDQEATTLAAQTAKEAAERQFADRGEEIVRLSSVLQQQEAAVRSADAARAAAEQRLATRFDEISRITSMLAGEGSRADHAGSDAQWLRQMMQVAQGFPKWWALMPANWRRTREHARYRRSGLFDAGKYLETYPDVAQHGMDPVRHYILHGMAEGRLRPV